VARAEEGEANLAGVEVSVLYARLRIQAARTGLRIGRGNRETDLGVSRSAVLLCPLLARFAELQSLRSLRI